MLMLTKQMVLLKHWDLLGVKFFMTKWSDMSSDEESEDYDIDKEPLAGLISHDDDIPLAQLRAGMDVACWHGCC